MVQMDNGAQVIGTKLLTGYGVMLEMDHAGHGILLEQLYRQSPA
jgi:hypothetical protein